MSILLPVPSRPISSEYMAAQTIAAGGTAHILHRGRGGRIGVGVRLEEAGQFAINIQPYSHHQSDAYGAGTEATIYESGATPIQYGSAVYTPPTSMTLIRIRNRGSAPITVRGLIVTDFPA